MVVTAELRSFSLVLLLMTMLLVVARVSKLRWWSAVLTQYVHIAAACNASVPRHCICLLASPNVVGLVQQAWGVLLLLIDGPFVLNLVSVLPVIAAALGW